LAQKQLPAKNVFDKKLHGLRIPGEPLNDMTINKYGLLGFNGILGMQIEASLYNDEVYST